MSKYLSDRVNQLPESPTLAISKLAKIKASKGHDVVNWGAGQPSFLPPINVRFTIGCVGLGEESKGMNLYAPAAGPEEFVEAARIKFKRDNGISYEFNQVTSACGAKDIIFKAMAATLNPGDIVAIPVPYWPSYPDIVRFNGGEAKFINTSANSLGKSKLTPAMLKDFLEENPTTKWVIINSANNPTGEVYSKEELVALGDVLEEYPDVLILSDDVYEPYVYDAKIFTSYATANPRHADRTLTVNAISKAFAGMGYRLGYAGGPKDLISAMNKINSQSISSACTLALAAATTALAGIEGDYDPLRRYLSKNRAKLQDHRDLAVSGMRRISGYEVTRPAGSMFLWIKMHEAMRKAGFDPETAGTDVKFLTKMGEEVDLFMAPGTAFGKPGYARGIFAAGKENINKGLERLETFTNEL